MAKCTGCFFELDWNVVERDVLGHPDSNYTTLGVSFRVRFLSKSHMATRTVDEQLYGCIFCTHLGHTVEDGDATVFFSQRQLFAHLARHPRPLPHVHGVTVLEGSNTGGGGGGGVDGEEGVPREYRNNYDLHFRNPPVPSPLEGRWAEVAALPGATAVETVKATTHALRAPADGKIGALSFAVGARIIGVEFPERYGGEWAVGWHDGVRGAIPANSIRLRRPDSSEVVTHIPSSMRAHVRWKFVPRYQGKEKERDRDPDGREWLKLNAGDVVENVTCE